MPPQIDTSPTCLSNILVRDTLTDQIFQSTCHFNHDRPCRSCDVWLLVSCHQSIGSITGPTIWDLYWTSWDKVLPSSLLFPCQHLPAKSPYSFICHPWIVKRHTVRRRITTTCLIAPRELQQTRLRSHCFCLLPLELEFTSRLLLSGRRVCIPWLASGKDDGFRNTARVLRVY